MTALIAHDDTQLRRLETAIMRIESGPPAERGRRACLLSALENERAELLRFSPKARLARLRPQRSHASAA